MLRDIATIPAIQRFVSTLVLVGIPAVLRAQMSAPHLWLKASVGGASSSGDAHYAQSFQRIAALAVGGRALAGVPLQLEGVWSRHAQTFACRIPLEPPPCYRPLDVTGVAGAVVLAPNRMYPRTYWAMLAGLGGYRLPVGGDVFRERLAASTALGAHLALEAQVPIGSFAGVALAFRPLLLPNVAGERLLLWPVMLGVGIWQ